MKKTALFILLLLFINIPSFAQAKVDSDELPVLMNKISSGDTKILEALTLMENSPASESYNIILGKIEQTNSLK